MKIGPGPAPVTLVAPLAVLLIAVFAGQRALAYGLWGPAGPGSGLLPLICSVALVLLGALDLLQRLAGRRPGAQHTGHDVAQDAAQAVAQDTAQVVAQDPAQAVEAAVPSGRAAWRPVLVYVAGLAGFALALEPLGFAVAAVLSMLAVIRWAEQRSWVESLVISVLAALFGWLLFAVLLSVNLPRGRWLALA